MKQKTLNMYLREKYGKKLYKVSINAGFTCPNRDGTLGSRGCIFCSGNGSGDFAEDPAMDIKSQIEAGKRKILNKLPKEECGIIAYFQAFTNTYASIEYLRKVYYEAMENPNVEILDIATRPDCLSEEVLDLLSEINEKKPVWVELGLQSIHEKTSEYIRRGYPLSTFDEAVKHLQERNLETIVHVILGLPGEREKEMLETVDYVGKSGVQGIKLQLLHVLKNTDLAGDYEAGKFRCLTEDEYIDILKKCIDILPESMIIHRMTGDGDKRILIAPLWSADKKHVINRINREIIMF